MSTFDGTNPEKEFPGNDCNRSGVVSKTSNFYASPKTKKWQRVLTYLASGRSLNRFEAERVVNDHCLHSSISGLERDSGIVFDRRFETVPCLRGTADVRVKRYWLRPEPENIQRARAALGLPYDAARGDNEAHDE